MSSLLEQRHFPSTLQRIAAVANDGKSFVDDTKYPNCPICLHSVKDSPADLVVMVCCGVTLHTNRHLNWSAFSASACVICRNGVPTKVEKGESVKSCPKVESHDHDAGGNKIEEGQ